MTALALETSPLLATAAQIVVTSNVVVQDDAELGTTYRGAMLLRNTSDAAQAAHLFQTDYAFTADGRTSFAAAGTTPRSTALWIDFHPREVVIPAGATASIDYVVTVPEIPALSGTYWSLLMVYGVHTPSAASGKRAGVLGPREIGLNVATRYATQIATHVGTDARTRLVVDSVKGVTMPDGHRGLCFDFANTGERANSVTITVELYDYDGRQLSKHTQVRGLMYPGSSARQTFDVGALPAGMYRALVVMDTGGEEIFGENFRIRL